jgi:hypothetical protein
MILLNKFIGKSIKTLGEFLGQSSDIVAAVEINEATDPQKALEVIKRSVKRGAKSYVIVLIEI